ncbi:DUF192 domain-containing protein [bacterium]|nr:DUF192 domain-containing protein [bacterium]
MKTALLTLIQLSFFLISAENICGYPKDATVEVTSATGEKKFFSVGIAETDALHEKGLMYCRKMEKNQGLFFIFDNDRQRFFWMKNTTIELAVIFIDRDFNVVSVRRGVPLSKTTIPSVKPVRYVLEVNWESGKSVLPGDKVKLKML